MSITYPVKIEFREYPSGSWADWSQYLVEPPSTNQRVESDNEGEAGAIVFDSASVTFRYKNGNPVYTAFSANLTFVQRYLFRIHFPKTNKSPEQRFEGMADFSTIAWNTHNNEISFDVVDKLSALGILSAEQSRVVGDLTSRVLAQQPTANDIKYLVMSPGVLWLIPSEGGVESVLLDLSSTIIKVGEILSVPLTHDPLTEYKDCVVLQSSLETFEGHTYNKVITTNDVTDSVGEVIFASPFDQVPRFYEKELYGIDINNISGGVLQSLKGIEIIQALYSQAWPGTTLIKKPGDLTFNIPAEYAVRFLDENPLGEDPLDALITLTNSIKPSGGTLSGCYVYVDKSGSLVIHARDNVSDGGTARTLGSTKVISKKKRYFWDKIIDGATVTVKSWITDPETGEFLEGIGTRTLQAGSSTGFIKPKNEIKKELIVDDPDLNTQALLDAFAAAEAQNLLDFYGKRRAALDLSLNLDDNTIVWDIMDTLTIDTVQYFLIALEIDGASRTVTAEAVETAGHSFDFRQIVVPLSESNAVGSVSSGSSSGGGTGSVVMTGEYTFAYPLINTLGEVSLQTTDNLILTLNALDTAQPIKTTDTPTFNQLTLTAQASLITEAVRADRSVLTAAPLTGGGDLTANLNLGLAYNGIHFSVPAELNSLNAKNILFASNNGMVGNTFTLGGTLTVDTPQDIRTTASPTFNWLTLTGNLQFQTQSGYTIQTNTGDLTISPVDGYLKLEALGDDPNILIGNSWLKREGFVSQLTGWGISPIGEADFRYIYTDELHAKAFIADLEQALAGGQIICKSVALVAADFQVPAAGSSRRLIVESFAGFETAAVYQNSDWVRLRQFSRTAGSLDISDCWGTVVLDTTYGSSGFDAASKTQAYTFTRSTTLPGYAITNSYIKTGTLALDYGVSGNGFLESNAIDGLWGQNSPYHQVATWTTNPANKTLHSRLGNLRGITGVAGEYGIILGAGVTTSDKYLRASNQVFQIHNIPYEMYSGANKVAEIDTSGNMKLGTNVTAVGTASFDFTSSSGALRLGYQAASKANLYFDGSSLYLRTNTTPTITLNPDGTAIISNSLTLGSASTTGTLKSYGVTSLMSNDSGFIMANSSSGQMRMGQANGTSLVKGWDWNVSTANLLTVKGDVLASRFSTKDTIGTFVNGVDIEGQDIFAYYQNLGTNYRWRVSASGMAFQSGNPFVDDAAFTPIYIQLGRNADCIRLEHTSSFGMGISTTEDMKISTSAGTMLLQPTGNLIVDPVSNYLNPANNYDINLGQNTKQFLTLYAAELYVPRIVSEEVIATIGGRILVTPSTTLIFDVVAGATQIYVKHNELASGDRILFQARGNVEFMAITSAPTASGGGYRYNVTRNLDGSGSNDWFAGDGVVNTGTTGDGFIEMYSTGSVKGGAPGPTIVGNIRNSATFNDWSEYWAIGNLGGLYGRSAGEYGLGLGKYANSSTFMTIIPGEGIKYIKRSSGGANTTIASWNDAGTITVGETALSHIKIDVGSISLKYNTATRIFLNGDGSGYVANNYFNWDVNGNITAGGWRIGNGTIYSYSSTASIVVGTATNKITIASAGTDVSTMIYARNNVWGSSTNGFYMDASGRFGLGDQLTWSGPGGILVVQGSAIVNGTITSAKIAAGTIVASNIQAGTITGNLIAAATIVGSNIAAGTITAANIAAGTITGSLIAATTIAAGNIIAGTITATQIAASTITGAKIAAGTITASNILTLTMTGKSCTFDTGTIGGWTLGTTKLYGGVIGSAEISCGDNPYIKLNSANISGTTPSGAGVFFQAISGAGQALIGSVTASKYLSYISGNLDIVGGVITGGTVQTGTSGQRVVITGSSNDIKFYPGSGTAVSLYANASNTLFTSGSLQVEGSQVTVYPGGANAVIISGITGGMIIDDVNIYRGASNVLKTDDSLQVAGQSLLLSHGTSKFITCGINGVAAPAVNSLGTKFILYGGANDFTNNPRYAMGVEASTLWLSSAGGYKFYKETSGSWASILDIDSSGVIKAGGYKSSDGTAGMTGTKSGSFGNVTIKNGLITAWV